MYTLVVIDMQEEFDASKKVVKQCANQILKAKKDKAPIIFVEYDSYCPTYPELTKLTKSYKASTTIIKDMDDGSTHVRKALLRKKFPKNHLRICGVNTDFCVFATVNGLTSLFPKAKLEVIRSACNSENSHTTGISLLKNLNNVTIK